MSLRSRIFIAIFMLATAISLALSYTLFTHMRDNHIETLQKDLTTIASIAAWQINGDDITYELRNRRIMEAVANSAGIYRAFLVKSVPSRDFLWESIGRGAVHAGDGGVTGYGTVFDARGDAVALLGVEADAATIDQNIKHLALRILLIALAAIGLSGLGSFILARAFTKRIGALEAALSEIATGKYETSLEVNQQEETARLARIINELAANLHKRRSEQLVSAIEALVAALDAKDAYTYGHSSEVALIAERMAEYMGQSEEDLFRIRFAALLHDIGKIGVPDSILNKHGPLSHEERACIQQHPKLGAKIIAGIPAMHDIAEIILHHHECWDGRGYPEGLAGSHIPLGARIIAIADAYQAMTSDRPYRKGMSRDEAMAEICRCSGTQFDPALVAVFQRTGGRGVAPEGTGPPTIVRVHNFNRYSS
ncbi:HD-GYP domain-containing protein [Anaeroselena agilis]|uniref:HD domain-containing protein n=1 Tax=Anaeroselena agilis TaxID=3063788 RepID=A0ABU3NS55_9FIRM|nr:HD domain-containing protein [Selenomonadales bacterium 4137-cl]